MSKALEKFSELKKDITTHKEKIKPVNSENVFKRKQIDKFFDVVKSNLNQIDQNKYLTEEQKEAELIKLIETSENEWNNQIKTKYKAGKKLEGLKRNLNQEWYDNYFKEKRGEVEDDIINNIGDEIKNDFPFDGEFEMPNDFNDLMTQYNDAIRDLKLNLNTSWSDKKRKKYENAINILEGHKKQLKLLKDQESNIDTDELKNKYDEAVDKIISSDGYGEIKVNIFGIEQTFHNKAEALYALKESKKQLYEEFKSGFRSSFETLAFLYKQPLMLSKSLIFGEIEDGEHSTFDTVGLGLEGLEDMSKIFNGEVHYFALGLIEEGLALGIGIAGFSMLATFAGLHRGVGESIYRRGLKDPISKLVASMQYEDYGRTGKVINDFTTKEGKEFLEYQQREGLMEMFKQKLHTDYTPGTPEYDEYKKKIDTLDSYKLNKTKTFYSLAYKVSRGMPLGIKGNLDFNTLLFNARRTLLDGSYLYGYNPFKKDENGKWIRIKNKDGDIRPRLGGFHKVEIDRHQALYNDTEKLLSEMNIELEKGVKIFYEEKEVKTENEDGKLRTIVEGGETKTEKYKNIIDYINSKKISSIEKKKLIKKFDEYIKKLGNTAKSELNIHKDIYLLLEQDFRPTNEHLSDLDNELKKIENRFTNTQKLKNKIPFNNKLNNEYNLLKEFRELIYSGQWIGTEEEYKKAINEIKTNKTKISANISIKLGTGDPKTKFNDIINNGQKVFRESERIKNNLFSKIGDDIEQSKPKDYLKNIQDYISYKIDDNEIETKAKKELNNYINKLIKGEILVESELQLKTEIAKILKGGLTEISLINKLDECVREDFSNAQKQKVKDLKNEIIRNPKTIITEDEIDKIVNEIIDGRNLTSIRIDHSKVVDLTTIDNDINSAKGMRKKDIFPEGANETKLKEDFDKLKAIIEFDDKGNTSLRTQELNILKENILNKKNNYTISQALYTINEIEDGKNLKNIISTLAPDTSITLEDYINDKVKNLKTHFIGLSLDEKIKYLENNKEFYGNNFKKSILEEHIENTISEIDKSSLSNPEKVEKAEELRKSIKNELDSNRIKSSIDSLIGLKGISALESSLKSFENEVRKQNPNKSRLKTIITELDKLYANTLADNDLRDRIDILKTEINDTNSSPKKSPKAKTSPETDFDKMNYSDKYNKISDLIDRALLKAELEGIDEKNPIITDLLNKDIDKLIKDPSFNYSVFETKTKRSIGLSTSEKLDSYKKLNILKTKADNLIKTNLISRGALDMHGKIKDRTILKTILEETENLPFAKYIMKLLT